MNTLEIEKPLGTINLAEEVTKGFDDSDKLSARLNRYSIAKKRALENFNELQDTIPVNAAMGVRYEKAWERLGKCGSYLLFRQFYTVGKTRLHKASFCMQHLICPLCAIRRGSKSLDAYLKRYHVIKADHPAWKLSMITLTVKNGNDLEERFEHLQKALKRVFERRRDWLKKGWGLTEWRKVHGWVGTYEVTNQGQGWHPHAHLMVLHSESFNYKAMQEEWKTITKDSHVINVSAAHRPNEPELDFLEVFKYAVKFSDLSPAQNLYVWDTLRSSRLLMSGGAFRGVKVPESLMDEEPLENLPYVDLLYQYTVSGYSLKHY